jgi:hypothetical protein
MGARATARGLIELLAALGLAAMAGCAAAPGDRTPQPGPGQAVAFAEIRVAAMRASTLAIHEADPSGVGIGPRAATIRARQGRRTYRAFLAPGTYTVTGIVDPAAAGSTAPGDATGTLVFEVGPGQASWFGSFDMLLESGRLATADLGAAAFSRARADFTTRYADLAARFAVVDAVGRIDRLVIAGDGGPP